MIKAQFYQTIRAPLFGGHLTQTQVDGLEALLDQGEQQSLDSRWIAYVLATVHHETDRTMQPIREYGLGKGRPYGEPDPVTHETYYGRGFVQLTHKENYQTMSDKLGVDLVNNPDKALELDIAKQIIYLGMIEGLFTHKKLDDFFQDSHSDWYNARMIVNGLDRAALIQGYALAYYKALVLAAKIQPPPLLDTWEFKLHVPDNQPSYLELERASLLTY